MMTDTTKITLITESTVDAKNWEPKDNKGAYNNAPILLISSEADSSHWSSFANAAAASGEVYAIWNVDTYTFIQTIWAIGEPASVIAHGKEASNIALDAARFAKGAIRAMALVDYGLNDGEVPAFNNTTCSIVLVRGRQSEIVNHQQIVAARVALGDKCKLVELENCGNRAAESCPEEFATTIKWFLQAATTD